LDSKDLEGCKVFRAMAVRRVLGAVQ